MLGASFFSYAPHQKTTAIKITVKLIEDVELPAFCGTVVWTGTYKFEVDSVSRGIYFDKYIKIRFECPREMGEKFFIKNNIYSFLVKKVESNFFKTDSLNIKLQDNTSVYQFIGIGF